MVKSNLAIFFYNCPWPIKFIKTLYSNLAHSNSTAVVQSKTHTIEFHVALYYTDRCGYRKHG